MVFECIGSALVGLDPSPQLVQKLWADPGPFGPDSAWPNLKAKQKAVNGHGWRDWDCQNDLWKSSTMPYNARILCMWCAKVSALDYHEMCIHLIPSKKMQEMMFDESMSLLWHCSGQESSSPPQVPCSPQCPPWKYNAIVHRIWRRTSGGQACVWTFQYSAR